MKGADLTVNIIRTASGSLDTESYKNIDGTIAVDGMTIDVTVIDARLAYGRLDFCVQPKSGAGSKWVSSNKVAHTSKPVPSNPKMVLRDKTKRVPLFREEVARRKAESSKCDARETLTQIKSYMDLLIQKEEKQ